MKPQEVKLNKKELGHFIDEYSELYGLMYYYLAKEYIDSFGKNGELALRRTLQNYGKARGKRLCERREKQKLPINIKTLFTNYDLPSDSISKRNQFKLNENERESYTFVCNLEKTRLKEGGKQGDYIGSIARATCYYFKSP